MWQIAAAVLIRTHLKKYRTNISLLNNRDTGSIRDCLDSTWIVDWLDQNYKNLKTVVEKAFVFPMMVVVCILSGKMSCLSEQDMYQKGKIIFLGCRFWKQSVTKIWMKQNFMMRATLNFQVKESPHHAENWPNNTHQLSIKLPRLKLLMSLHALPQP